MSAAPSSVNDEMNVLDDSMFGLMDIVTKTLDDFLKKVTCSLDTIGEIVKETDFKSDFEKFKAAVEDVFKNDLKLCMQTKSGLKEKMK